MMDDRVSIMGGLLGIAIVAGATVAAIHFEDWRLLWFYLLVVFCI